MPKTIFHTTEKSNFVLNMDLEKYRNFCAKFLGIILMIVGGSELFCQLTGSVSGNFEQMIADGGFGMILALLSIVLRSIATIFSMCGVFVIVAVVVGGMRAQLSKKLLLAYGLAAASLVWSVISLFNSFSYKDSLFGQDGRDEGFFAILIYIAMLLLGSMLGKEKHHIQLIKWVLIFGIVNCVFGLLQVCSFFDFTNPYQFIEPLLLQNVKLPCGMTDSPITFAMLLAMIACIAIPAALFCKDKKLRVLALVNAGMDMLLILKTQTLAGIIGAGLALGFALILVLTGRKKAEGKSFVLLGAMVGALAVSAGWVYVSPSLNGIYRTSNDEKQDNGFRLYDGGIIWDDGFYRLGTESPYNPAQSPEFEISSSTSVMQYAWEDGLRIIKKYPLVGTGPDCYWYMQLHNSMTLASNYNGVDRPYNDWLFIAATRGIPALVLYIALLAFCIVTGIRRRKETGSWVYLSALFAVIAYTLTSMVGISVLTVSPLMWMMLGVLIGVPIAEEPKKATEPTKKKKKS